MLLLAVTVTGYFAFSFLTKFKATSENIDFNITTKGVDVKIKKFKVIHENLGHKEWELKADIAEINQANNTTKMKNVQYVFLNKNNRKFKVYADSGILMDKTNDLILEGHVKMIIEDAFIDERFREEATPKMHPKP